MTTGVGSEGISLTSADRVVLYSPQWNPAVENKLVCRCIYCALCCFSMLYATVCLVFYFVYAFRLGAVVLLPHFFAT